MYDCDCMCVPEYVLCIQIYVKPINEQGRVPRLQSQSPFEKLQRQRERNINVTKCPVQIKPCNSLFQAHHHTALHETSKPTTA